MGPAVPDEGDPGVLAGRDVVVIGTSSGGVEALIEIARGLPADLPAAVFAVIHFPEGTPSLLPRILGRAGPLKAVHPEDGEAVRPGKIYAAPPGFHLLVENAGGPMGRVRLGRGPKENHHRPAADALFRSAALAHGPRVVGVVLTGAGDDGTAGLAAVKRRGGVAVVQDPEDALFASMPEHAIDFVDVDHRVPVGEMAPLLARLCHEPAGERGADEKVPEEMEFESKIAGLDPTVVDGGEHVGELSGFTCPECTGPLYEIHEGSLVRFRCRIGHAYSAEAVLDEKSDTLEGALYAALNNLEESAQMAERLAARARQHGRANATSRFESRAQEARQQARTIRAVLVGDAPDASADTG